jgi:heme ABC exporter ATP-binding subunit CcmA
MTHPAEVLEQVPAPRREPGEVVLSARGLTRSYGPRVVLENADLDIRAGELVGVTGANGAGKTTLLRVIAGLIDADVGTVSVDGLDPQRQRARYQRAIGFLSAGDRGLYARLSVRTNLEFWGRLALLGKKQLGPAIERMISTFALEELASRRVDRLSMGQRQRVRLAMTFIHSPRLVLLDEPRNSLDSDGTELLVNAVANHCAGGGATIWCAPTGEAIALPMDKSFLVEGGRLVSA